MQRLGKRTMVIETYVGQGHRHLHRTPSGFQFGYDESSRIVTSVDELEDFQPYVVEQVQRWLDADGVKEAEKVQLDIEVSEAANDMPGTLDAMAERLGPEVKAQLFSMMKTAMAGVPTQGIAPSGPGMYEAVDGGTLVRKADGSREFVPDGSILDEKEEAPKLAFAPVGAEDGNVDDGDGLVSDMKESKKKSRRR